MSPLAQQQQALLGAVLGPWDPQALAQLVSQPDARRQRGLQAYRSHGQIQAGCVLQAAYPALGQMVGDDNLQALARQLWRSDPPARGDLAQWGQGLADLLAATPALAGDAPYLPDVARAEWALHLAATAADGDAQPHTLALLTTHDPADLRLQLAPGTAVLRSAWPLATLVLAHRDDAATGTDQATPAGLEHAAAALHAGVAEDALVWRKGLRPCLRACSPGEADFITALLAGQTLAGALDAAPTLDFGAWLARAVADQLWTFAQTDTP